ncbi:translocation/assembly module TamB domain-containing protein [Kozakia baliensis]|uniref:translocation/assembly module TamB domain-containing protein n=1 Tax=Kozakia baliensis TaxID=153496 RepID=UPI00049834F4|nr:translocation/assembly module TamB domain-containing protein [Kozakia baliensis]
MTADTPKKPHRRRRIIAWVAGLTLGVPVGLLTVTVATVLVAANTAPGQRYIAHETSALTGGMVQIDGFSGTFPTSLRIRHLAVNDAKGSWLTVDDLALGWSPLALIHMDVSAQYLTASKLAVIRLPESSSQTEPQKTASTGKSSLHFRIDLAKIQVDRIEVGAPLAGVPAAFALNGHIKLQDLAPVLDGLALDHLPRSDIGIDLKRLDGPGHLALDFSSPRGAIGIHLVAQDGAGGFMTSVAKMEQFDPADLRLDLHGPLQQARLDFGAKAGPVTASIAGPLDLLKNRGDLTIHAQAPAMSPQPGIAWNAMNLAAHVKGDLKAPAGDGALDIDQLAANGAAIGHLRATFDGDDSADEPASRVHLHMTADGLRVPGAPPALLASAPLVADLVLHPKAQGMPVTLNVTHPLAQLGAQAMLKPAAHGALDLTLPNLTPLGQIGKVDLAGHDVTHVDFALPETAQQALTLNVISALAITGGMKPAVGLVGPDGKLALNLAMTTQGKGKAQSRHIDIKHLTFDGRAVHLKDEGQVDLADKTTLATQAHLTLTDLARIDPSLRGHTDIDLEAQGATDDLAAKTHIAALFGTKTVPQGPITLDAAFTHLPKAPEGTITASGTLDRANLLLDMALSRDEQGNSHIDLHKLDWNSLTGRGKLMLPNGAKVPLGDMDIQARNLADFSALVGQKLAGHLGLTVHTTQPDTHKPPRVALSLGGMVRSDAASVGKLDLGGTVVDPAGDPDLDMKLAVNGLNAQGITGQANATARGKQSALAITAKANLQNVMDAPANLDTALLLNLPKKQVRLDRLTGVVKGEALRLASPALVSFGEKMGVDRLRLSVAPPGVAPASLDVAGTIKPALNMQARVDHLTPALAKPFAPSLDAVGTLSAQAKLGGTLEKPTGNASLTARGVRMRTGPAASLPPASLDATVALLGTSARIDTALNAGSKIALAVRGTAPTGKTGPLALNANGHVDLSVANAVAGAQGMALGGQVAVNMGVTGTMAAPRATGQIGLQQVSFNDYAQGVRLSDINGALVASGDSLALQNIVAKAGSGTIGLNGTVGVLRAGMPLDLHIVAQKAQPITSDLLTMMLDSDLHIYGQATTRLDVDGKLRIPTATVNIPNSMPASVPQLEVIRPGQKAPTRESSLLIGLNIDVISPGSFFVRGHGLDAEMMGKLHVGGLSSAPQVSGGFDLRRGNFNLAGINLNFTHGRVGFNGSGVTHKLDPTLDFRADRNVQGTLASLLVTGYASEPKIDFTSSPSLPRDQVLAMLLFGTTTASLSTTQMAELGAAVAQIAGGSSFDPLGKIRNTLGLDRFAVGGGNGVDNGGASLEAGKYVMKGVYVGAKQATSGSGTQAQVQVDLTKRLKLNTTVGTGGQVNGFTTPENDPGSSVGLSYGFDY